MDSSILLHGRPFGGCTILFRKSLISSVPMLSTNAKHFCAVQLSEQSGYIVLLICVYLPTDYVMSSSCDDFLYVISELEGFINSQPFNSLLIAGDFNVDFARSTPNTSQLIQFMEEFDLASVDLSYHADVQFTMRVVTALRGLIISVLSTTLPLPFPLFKSLILLLISLITIPSLASLITQFVVLLIWCLLRPLNSPLYSLV